MQHPDPVSVPQILIQHEPAIPSSPRRQNKIYTFDSIVADLDMGQFYAPALLVDQILRDERVRGAFEQRCGTLLGKPLAFEPADESQQAQDVALEVEELWARIFPADTLRQLLEWSLFLGIAFARLNWKKVDGYMIPVAEVWHPSAIAWDRDERAYRIRHTEGEELVRLGDPGWLILPRFGFEHAGRRGLLRSVVDPYARRQWNQTDWSRFNEQLGKPIPVITGPSNATKDDLDTTVRAVARAGSEGAIGLRKGEKEGWSVELLESMSQSYESFHLALGMLAQDLAVVVLGQWMSTEGQAGLGANSKSGDPVRIDLQLADAGALAEACREQVVKPLVDYNFTPTLTPWPCWHVKPAEDLASKAQMLNNAGDALKKLRAQYKQALDMRLFASEFGLGLVEGVDIPEYADPPPPPTGGFGGPPVDPTSTNVARFKAERVRAQSDVDKLVDAASSQAADPAADTIAEIVHAMRRAESFDVAKRELLLTLRMANTEPLENVLTKAQILAKLRGRLAVKDETK